MLAYALMIFWLGGTLGVDFLHEAVQNQETKNVAKLLEYKFVRADIDRTDKFGENVLHKAARLGNEEIVEALLNNGARELMEKCYMSHTPLKTAILLNKKKAARVLMEAGANVNALDEDGNTCVHVAVANRSPLLKEILSKKPTLDVRNVSGKTPLDIALDMRWLDGILRLLKAGSPIENLNEDTVKCLMEDKKIRAIARGRGWSKWVKIYEGKKKCNEKEDKGKKDSEKKTDDDDGMVEFLSCMGKLFS